MPNPRSESARVGLAPVGPSPEEVRAQLERILGHRRFEASGRTRELLRFLVEEALAGRSHRLKGYTIAVELFGRPRDFNANLDPIVRIQAGRLRRALEHYYLVAGTEDPILIAVPKGGYVPVFTRSQAPSVPPRTPSESVLDTVPRQPRGVAVAVLPLREIPASPESGFFADGLAEELCNELSRYQDLAIVPYRQVGLPADSHTDYATLSSALDARFLLEGSVRRGKVTLKVSVRLIDGPNGNQVWAEGYRCPLSAGGLIEVQEQIAQSVSAAVGSEYGVISRRIAAEARKVAPVHLSTYEAVLCWLDFQVDPTPEAGAGCLAALQAAVEREPDYGPAWAALSEMMLNAYCLDLPGVDNARGKMAEYAGRAATLSPGSQLARGALAHSHLILGEREAFLREIEKTLELNPGSPFWVGATGYLLTLAGEYERGGALLEKAVASNPCHPRVLNHGLYVYHYQRGDYDRAYQETLEPSFGIGFWGPLLQAAVLGQLDRAEEAQAAAGELLAIVPDFESRARDITGRPILAEEIVDGLLDGLRKAGLRIER
jgi:adenylate cyclase